MSVSLANMSSFLMPLGSEPEQALVKLRRSQCKDLYDRREEDDKKSHK